jgi:hypothetical protein
MCSFAGVGGLIYWDFSLLVTATRIGNARTTVYSAQALTKRISCLSCERPDFKREIPSACGAS